MRTIVVAAAGALLIALPTGSARGASGFTPKTIAGTYKGTWNNTTFNVQGGLSITFAAKQKNKVLKIAAAITGTAFGCMTAPTFPALSLTKGSGANHWDSTGWRIKKSGSFGSVTAKFKGGKLTGSGTAPPSCAPGVTYKIDGAIRSGTLSGVATITLPSQTARTTFNAVKS